MAAGLLAGFMIAWGGAIAGEPLHYEPAVVSLSGILVIEDHYGPPNYGENPDTDEIDKVRILKLDTPVDVVGDPNADNFNSELETGVQKMQLVSSLKLIDLEGQHVTVEGTLYHQFNAHHVTKVLITVEKISRTEK